MTKWVTNGNTSVVLMPASQPARQTDRQTDRQMYIHTYRQTYICTYRQTECLSSAVLHITHFEGLSS